MATRKLGVGSSDERFERAVRDMGQRPDPDDADTRRALANVQASLFGARSKTTKIERYELGRRLGSGGAGTVFEAHDPVLERDVAVKLVHPTDAPLGTAARMLREAKALASLKHPNVVAVHDVGEHIGDRGAEPGVFIVMELVEGANLRRWLRASERDWRAIVGIFIQAAEGLAAAHTAGLVHRDFKPSNVVVDGHDVPKVLDFGIALTRREWSIDEPPSDTDIVSSGSMEVSTDDERPRLTAAGTVVGTPGYMAPEHEAGGRVDARSDQYSFFVALYEALEGRRPGTDPSETLARPKVSYPRHLRRTVLRGLAPRPADRFPDMAAAVAALRWSLHARRRRWALVAACVVGLVPGVLGARAVWSARACEQQAAAVDRVWSPERAETVRAALSRHDLAFADATAERAIAKLDAFAMRWRLQRMAGCRASETQPRGAAAMACLDAGLAAMAETVELLERAEPSMVARATQLVANLPAPESCSDPVVATRVAGNAARSSDPKAAEVRATLARSQVQRAAGETRRALDLAKEAYDLSVRANDPRAEVAALAQVGVLECTLRRDPAALADLERAYYRAVELGDDFVAMQSAVELSRVSAVDTSGAAQRWFRQAEALTSRMDAVEAYEARLTENLGLAAVAEERFDDAEAHFTRSLEMLEAAYGNDDVRLVQSLTNLASVDLQRGRRLEMATARLERSLRLATDQAGPLHPMTITAQVNYGAALYLLGANQAAVEQLEQALAAAERTYGRDGDIAVTIHQNLAEMYGQFGDRATARAHLDRAIASLGTQGRSETSVAFNVRLTDAQLRFDWGDREGARRDLEALLDDALAAEPRRTKLVARIIEELGWLDLAEGRVESAGEQFAEAVAFDLEHLGEGSDQLADARLGEGAVAAREGRVEDARRLLAHGLAYPRARLPRRKLDVVLRTLQELLGESCPQWFAAETGALGVEQGSSSTSWTTLADAAQRCLTAEDAATLKTTE